MKDSFQNTGQYSYNQEEIKNALRSSKYDEVDDHIIYSLQISGSASARSICNSYNIRSSVADKIVSKMKMWEQNKQLQDRLSQVTAHIIYTPQNAHYSLQPLPAPADLSYERIEFRSPGRSEVHPSNRAKVAIKGLFCTIWDFIHIPLAVEALFELCLAPIEQKTCGM